MSNEGLASPVIGGEAVVSGTVGLPQTERYVGALARWSSSTSAAAMAVYAATRVISLLTYGLLLPLRRFRNPRVRHVWPFLSHGWDANWYARIAVHGYQQSDPATFHFYPGYPAAIAAIRWIPGLGEGGAAIIVTFIAGLAAAAGLARLCLRLTGDARPSVLAVALWAVAPAAFVLSMAYSEALTCALAVWALNAVADRRWLLGGVLTMLAGTVHTSAVALVAAVEVAALIAAVQALRGPGRKRPRDWLRPAAAMVISPLGLIGFWCYVAFVLHSPGGWLNAESSSGGGVDWGASLWRNLFIILGGTRTGPDPFRLLFVLAILAAIGLSAWTLTERIPAYIKVYVLCTVLLAVLSDSSSLSSKIRILLPAMLIGLPLARILAPARTYVLVPMLVILAAASAWLTLLTTIANFPP